MGGGPPHELTDAEAAKRIARQLRSMACMGSSDASKVKLIANDAQRMRCEGASAVTPVDAAVLSALS
jgi:hypothetical protein